MDHRSIVFSVLVAAGFVLGCSAPASESDDGNAGGSPTTGGGSSGGGSSGDGSGGGGDETAGGSSGRGGDGSDSGGAADGGASGSGGSSGSGGAGAIANSCSTGVLFAGDPLYNDKPDAGDPKPAGQGLLDDPPIRSEAMAIIGDRVFIETEFEIWSVDLGQDPPVLSRFAGQEGDGFVDAGLPCAETRFLVVRDMTATADGKLVVVDYVGGAIIEITDPAGPNCQSHWVAGTHERTEDPGAEYPLAQGDQDGPGAQALFGGIRKVTTDPQGNIYTFDDGTGKFKKVATDDDRTVSTIGLGSADDNILGLAFLNGKLYATGVDGSNDFLIEVDPAAYDPAAPEANVHDVFRNRGEQFTELDGSGKQAITAQVLTDGEALIVSGQSGYVWRVGVDGSVLATLAGTGAYLDYEDGFDPLVTHPADEWQLVSAVSNSNGGPWLALGDGKLYWAGGLGVGKYVVQFSCP